MFRDRKDAGKRLAKALERYKKPRPLVLAIPRGGAEVGYEVASYLHSDFSVVVCRKLPFPDNPEAGFGAVAEDGSSFTIIEYIKALDENTVGEIVKTQQREIRRQLLALRNGRPLPEIKARVVILVDDGIAMGSTMRAAMELCRKKQPKRLIVAAPVSSRKTEKELAPLADEVVILEKPRYFSAVAQAYENWYDVPNEEVAEILKRKFTR